MKYCSLIPVKKCSAISCLRFAESVLLNNENEFVGLYCEEHGEERSKRLEERFEFIHENTINKPRVVRNLRVSQGLRRALNKKEHRGIICGFCKKEFYTNKSNRKYCSSICRFANWDKQHPRSKEKECSHCHKQFTTAYKTTLYCSNKCKFNAFMERNYTKIEKNS